MEEEESSVKEPVRIRLLWMVLGGAIGMAFTVLTALLVDYIQRPKLQLAYTAVVIANARTALNAPSLRGDTLTLLTVTNSGSQDLKEFFLTLHLPGISGTEVIQTTDSTMQPKLNFPTNENGRWPGDAPSVGIPWLHHEQTIVLTILTTGMPSDIKVSSPEIRDIKRLVMAVPNQP